VVRVALGLIFLLSATAKLRDPTRFVRAVLDYALLRGSLARLYGRMLPFVELGTALLLLSGFFLPIAAALAMLMLTSFAIAITAVTVQGRELGCHCFGEASTSHIGWHSLVRDLLLLLPVMWLLATGMNTNDGMLAWLRAGMGSSVATIALAALFALAYWLVVQWLDVLASLVRPRSEIA